MADQPPAAAQAPAKKDRKKLVMIAVAVLVVAYFGYGKFVKPPAAAAGVPTAPVAAPAPTDGEVVEVGQMTVNLASPKLHYARVSFSVVLPEGGVADGITPHLPLLKDAALTEIGRSTPEGLRTPEGVDDLRKRLTARAVEIYPPDEATKAPQLLRVVLTELVVQ
jgi:flagellar basal body-associated protein FliL